MIQNAKSGKVVQLHGFLVGAEVEEGTDIEQLANKLADSLMWVEGVGTIDVEHLGVVDTVPEGNWLATEGDDDTIPTPSTEDVVIEERKKMNGN